jgi:hypothetical protein
VARLDDECSLAAAQCGRLIMIAVTHHVMIDVTIGWHASSTSPFNALQLEATRWCRASSAGTAAACLVCRYMQPLRHVSL